MSVLAAVQDILPFGSQSEPRNPIREAWDRLHRLPGGKKLFSRSIGIAAPYSGSIDAQVVELTKGYAKVTLADRRKVRNHLQCVHAIALANLAEICGNVALAYSMPDDARFIVAGLEMEYLKKARGLITAECQCPVPTTNERHEYQVVVSLYDKDSVEVTRCTLRTLVGPKPSA